MKTNILQWDIDFVKKLLPSTYTVRESKKTGSIHCVSPTGIFQGAESEDDEHWSYILKALKQHFQDRFQEVNHNVCFNHTDFTIYLKQ